MPLSDRSAYNFLRDLLNGADWYPTAIEHEFGSDLQAEARRIINHGSGLCLGCLGHHEDGQCPDK